jgi:DNA invertase Pin-like site-specific DNA recombinase
MEAAVKPAFLLARVSTLKHTQDQSPERQLENLRAYCARKGWQILEEATERKSGAKGIAQRPALARAMALARQGEIGAICVTRLDRLGRSLHNLLETSDELARLGVELVILDFGLDTSTPTGKFSFSMLGAVAQFTRDIYAEAAAEGKQRAVAAGKHCARPPEVVQPEALAVISALRAGNLRWKDIPAELARRGYKQWGRVIKSTGRTRLDRPWPVSSLKRAYARNQKPPAGFGCEPQEESGKAAAGKGV